MTAVTATDRPKLVRYRCLMERFAASLCMCLTYNFVGALSFSPSIYTTQRKV